MPTFTKEEIVHLGDLARIALTDEEITRLQGELNVIADSINKVQEVATDDVEPTANPIPLEAYLRPDVPETPLTQEEATAGAPVSEAGMFVAPRILGRSDMSELVKLSAAEMAAKIKAKEVSSRELVEAHLEVIKPPSRASSFPEGVRRSGSRTGRRLRCQVR